MEGERRLVRHRSVLLVLAAVVPVLVCAGLTTVRDQIENTNAALLLVLIVVGAASLGLRSAGIVAAVSGAASFDFFLTAPYLQLAIADRDDLETFALLVLVGVAVTEVALWGRRQQARASEESGYVSGLVWSGDESGVADDHVQRAERQLIRLLGVDTARFSTEPPDGGTALLMPSGEISRSGHLVDVERAGLPTDTEIVVPVRSGRTTLGQFVLVASAHVARPTRRQRQVAVLLADRIGEELARAGASATD